MKNMIPTKTKKNIYIYFFLLCGYSIMVYLNPTRFKKQQEANNNKIKWVDNDLLK